MSEEEPTKKFDKHKWLGRLFQIFTILIFAVVNMGLGAALAQEHYADAAYFGFLGLFWLGFMVITQLGAIADARMDGTLEALERVKAVIDRVEGEDDEEFTKEISDTHDKLLAKVFRKIVKETDTDTPPTDEQISQIVTKFKDITGHDAVITRNPDGFLDVEIDHDNHGHIDKKDPAQTELPLDKKPATNIPVKQAKSKGTKVPVRKKSIKKK